MSSTAAIPTVDEPTAPRWRWTPAGSLARMSAQTAPTVDEPTARRCQWQRDPVALPLPGGAERRRAELAERRAHRARGAAVKRQTAERESAREAMTNDARKRAAQRAVLDAQHRDQLRRAARFPLSTDALAQRVARACDALTWATEDERDDARAALMLAVGKRYGWTPMSDDVSASYLRRRASGLVLNARERDARREQLRDDESDDDDAQTAEDRLDALALRAGGSVWSVFAPPVRTHSAAETSADALADRLSRVLGEPLPGSARAALMAALAGYGSGAELAAAEGIAEGTARKRLHDGRAWLRKRMPDAESMAAALMDAQRLGADDDAPTAPRLTSAERAAMRAAEQTRRALSRTRKRSALPGSAGVVGAPVAHQWHPCMPDLAARGAARVRADAARERAERAALAAARERSADQLAAAARECALRAARANLDARAAVLRDDAAQLRSGAPLSRFRAL